MLYNLRNEYEVPTFKERVKRLLERGAVVELVEKKPQRSIKQNAYLHLLLGYYASEFGYSLEEVKFRFFKELCNKDIFLRERENPRKPGEKINYYRSSADLTTSEMTIAIERFRNYSSAIAGLYLPSPNEHEMQVYAQQQIDKNREFL